MKAPFPWFGGKRKVAPDVWAALGDVDNYVEPFAGSLAVLLGRPAWHTGTTSTVNDADRFISNFWRALIDDPEGVAKWADWPVNEADLEARHLWLVTTGRDRIEAMAADPDAYDVKVAGWWVWGICSWIGSGWCAGTGPWMHDENGLVRRRPDGGAGQGIKRQLPHLGNAGRGIKRQLPHLGDAGQGINRQLPHLGAGQGIEGYLCALAERLRNVRVVCGDWSRVVTNGALSYGASVGVFLDPPYLGDVRFADLYSTDDHAISHEVRDWCIANGDNPRYRIVLAGYKAEHDHLVPETWRRQAWTASAAHSTSASAARRDGNHQNRTQEMLWISPHCLGPDQATLFGGVS